MEDSVCGDLDEIQVRHIDGSTQGKNFKKSINTFLAYLKTNDIVRPLQVVYLSNIIIFHILK